MINDDIAHSTCFWKHSIESQTCVHTGHYNNFTFKLFEVLCLVGDLYLHGQL